jgi:CheY-like chemotaxis protein
MHVNLFTILYVEDDPMIRELYAPMLAKSFPVKVIAVSSAEEAIEYLKGQETFNLIVSDYEMPHGNGAVLLEYLVDNQRDIPFILFTNTLDPILRKSGNQYLGSIDKMEFEKLAKMIRERHGVAIQSKLQ